jgi:hypothetical protein
MCCLRLPSFKTELLESLIVLLPRCFVQLLRGELLVCEPAVIFGKAQTGRRGVTPFAVCVFYSQNELSGYVEPGFSPTVQLRPSQVQLSGRVEMR